VPRLYPDWRSSYLGQKKQAVISQSPQSSCTPVDVLNVLSPVIKPTFECVSPHFFRHSKSLIPMSSTM